MTVTATKPVTVSAVIDGSSQPPTQLRPGESIDWMATEELALSADDGGALDVTVDGQDRGVAGLKGQPWSATFVPAGSAS